MKKNTINNQRVVHMALLIFKKLPIFLMTLALTQCDDRDIPMFETETLPEAIGFSQVGFDALPGDIQDAFGKAELLSPRTPSASRQGGRVFSEIQTKSINKIARPDGTISYTAAVRKVSEGFYYDNFVVHRDSLGQIQNYIIRYQPTEEWYYNSQGSYDYSNFSGFITFYKPDGNVLASSEFISGVPVARPLEVGSANNAFGQMRSSSSSSWECSYEIQYAGVELGDGIHWTDYMVTVTCKLLWSGESESPDDTGDSFNMGTTPTGEEAADDNGGFGGEGGLQGEEEKVCSNSFKFCDVGSNWQAAGIKNVNIQFLTIGNIIGIQNIFFNELYFGFPKESSLVGGFLTNNNARSLAQEIMTEAEALTDLFYSINPNSTASQLRSYFYNKLGELLRNKGGEISTTAPLKWDCELIEHRTYFVFESLECN